MSKKIKKDNTIDVKIKKHYDKKGKHPHIIMGDIDSKHVSIGITHDKKKGKNSTNYGLEKDPLGSPNKSYMKRQGTVDNKRNYENKVNVGNMTEKDFAKAQEYAARAKEKYMNDKKNKKK